MAKKSPDVLRCLLNRSDDDHNTIIGMAKTATKEACVASDEGVLSAPMKVSQDFI